MNVRKTNDSNTCTDTCTHSDRDGYSTNRNNSAYQYFIHFGKSTDIIVKLQIAIKDRRSPNCSKNTSLAFSCKPDLSSAQCIYIYIYCIYLLVLLRLTGLIILFLMTLIFKMYRLCQLIITTVFLFICCLIMA